MKRLIILIAAVFCCSVGASAQSMSSNAIGLKFGGYTGNNYSGGGVIISYQRALSDANRLELNLGFNSGSHHSYVELQGFYQWAWNLDGGLNWFVGPGASIGSFKWKDSYRDNSNYTSLGIGGQIGLEYRFNIPLQLTLDYSPMYGLDKYSDGIYGPISLGIRYMF